MEEIDSIFDRVEPYVYELILFAQYGTSHVLNLTKGITFKNLDAQRKVYVVSRIKTAIFEHPQLKHAHMISPSVILIGFILGKPSFDINRREIYVGLPYRLISKNNNIREDPLYYLLRHKEKSVELFSKAMKNKMKDTFFLWAKTILGETEI
jgi:hypothetical protein